MRTPKARLGNVFRRSSPKTEDAPQRAPQSSHLDHIYNAPSMRAVSEKRVIDMVMSRSTLIINTLSTSLVEADLLQEVSEFVKHIPEVTIRKVEEFIDDEDNGVTARNALALNLSSMAHRYRAKPNSRALTFTHLHNFMLFAEDYINSCHPDFDRDDYFSLRVRFGFIMGVIKSQDLSDEPDFTTTPHREKQRLKAMLIIANVFYKSSTSISTRHRESDLLDCLEFYFDRRFEVADELRKHPDATPSDIKELMEMDIASMREGWL